MARERKQAAPEDFSDIQDAPVPSGVVPNIPIPPQEVIDQQAAMGRQMTPEEAAFHGRRPMAIPTGPATARHRPVRSMQQIVDEFLAEVSNHPDCKVLNSAIGGRPPKTVEFKDTPTSNQHMAELRIMWRDAPMEQVVMAQANDQKSAYEPGGKYYDLIPRKGDEAVSEPANQGGSKAWDHLIQKRVEHGEAVAT